MLGRSTAVAVACVPGMNRLEWYIMDLAAALAGFVVVPVHATLRRCDPFLVKSFNRWTVRCVVCNERDVEFYRDVRVRACACVCGCCAV